MSLTRDKLKSIVSKGENSKVDFKKTFNLTEPHQKEEFVKDVSAMANTPGGIGRLIYGISDKKEIIGISKSSFKETQMQQIVATRCDPKITFQAYITNYLMKSIGIVEIPYSHVRPHQVVNACVNAGVFFIRRGTTTGSMSVQEIITALRLRMEYDKHRLGDYDTLDPVTKRDNIRSDVLSILRGINFKRVGVWLGDYSSNHGLKEYYNPDIYENGAKRLRLFVSVGNSPKYWDFVNWFTCIRYFPRNKDKFIESKYLNVFLLITYESITPKTIMEYDTFYLNTFVRIVPYTYYHGLGIVAKDAIDTIDKDRLKWDLNNWFPKFFLCKIRSKQDLESRLDLMLNHVETFKESLNYFNKVWTRIIKKSR